MSFIKIICRQFFTNIFLILYLLTLSKLCQHFNTFHCFFSNLLVTSNINQNLLPFIFFTLVLHFQICLFLPSLFLGATRPLHFKTKSNRFHLNKHKDSHLTDKYKLIYVLYKYLLKSLSYYL